MVRVQPVPLETRHGTRLLRAECAGDPSLEKLLVIGGYGEKCLPLIERLGQHYDVLAPFICRPPYSMEEMVDTTFGYVRMLVRENPSWQRYHVVGHSAGAVPALRLLGYEHPPLSAAAFNPPSSYQHSEERSPYWFLREGAQDYLLEMLHPFANRKEMTAEALALLSHFAKHSLRSREFIGDLGRFIKEVHSVSYDEFPPSERPVFVSFGRRDTFFPFQERDLETLRRLYPNLTTHVASRWLFDSVGHGWPPVPSRVLRQLLPFHESVRGDYREAA